MGGPFGQVSRVGTELLQVLLFVMVIMLASDGCHTV